MDRGDNRAAVGVMTQTRSLEGRSLGMCPSLRRPEVSRLRLWEPGTSFVTAWGEQRRPMTGLNALREQSKMTRIEQEHGWVADG